MIDIAEEKNFENKVKKFLEQNDCWFVKYWAGGSFTKAGIPDLLCSCGGYFVGVELKASDGRPSELQKYNIRKIWESGGFAVILYPDRYEEFKKLVQALIDGRIEAATKFEEAINEGVI